MCLACTLGTFSVNVCIVFVLSIKKKIQYVQQRLLSLNSAILVIMWHVPRAPLFDVNVFTLMALVIVLQVHLVSLDLGGGGGLNHVSWVRCYIVFWPTTYECEEKKCITKADVDQTYIFITVVQCVYLIVIFCKAVQYSRCRSCFTSRGRY